MAVFAIFPSTKNVTTLRGEVNPVMVNGFYLKPFSGNAKKSPVQFHYLNLRKNETYLFELLDPSGKTLKSFEMKKEPIRDGDVALDMSTYPKGNYSLKMSSGKEFFVREFYWEKE